jgi:hypothetical protein
MYMVRMRHCRYTCTDGQTKCGYFAVLVVALIFAAVVALVVLPNGAAY